MAKKQERINMTFMIKNLDGYFDNKVAFPVCRKSKRLCKIINTSYLLPDELKVLELEGYDLKYKNEAV